VTHRSLKNLVTVWIHSVTLKYHVPRHVSTEAALYSFCWTHGGGGII